jgi:hypothetical protein
MGYTVELLLGTYRFVTALDPYPLLHNVELLVLKMEAIVFLRNFGHISQITRCHEREGYFRLENWKSKLGDWNAVL